MEFKIRVNGKEFIAEVFEHPSEKEISVIKCKIGDLDIEIEQSYPFVNSIETTGGLNIDRIFDVKLDTVKFKKLIDSL